MAAPDTVFFAQHLQRGRALLTQGLVTVKRNGPNPTVFWFVALVVGILAGFAALGFRLGIDWLQATVYHVDDVYQLHTLVQDRPWYQILILSLIHI